MPVHASPTGSALGVERVGGTDDLGVVERHHHGHALPRQLVDDRQASAGDRCCGDARRPGVARAQAGRSHGARHANTPRQWHHEPGAARARRPRSFAPERSTAPPGWEGCPHWPLRSPSTSWPASFSSARVARKAVSAPAPGRKNLLASRTRILIEPRDDEVVERFDRDPGDRPPPTTRRRRSGGGLRRSSGDSRPDRRARRRARSRRRSRAGA